MMLISENRRGTALVGLLGLYKSGIAHRHGREPNSAGSPLRCFISMIRCREETYRRSPNVIMCLCYMHHVISSCLDWSDGPPIRIVFPSQQDKMSGEIKLNWLLVDEPRDFEERIFQKKKTRLRSVFVLCYDEPCDSSEPGETVVLDRSELAV